MKKYFSTGMAILLPIVMTLMIVGILINFLTSPFFSWMQDLLIQSHLFSHPFLFLSESELIIITSKLLILLFLVLAVLVIGLLGKLFFIDRLFRLGNDLFHRLPYVNKIYKACQDVVHSLFSSNSASFSQVVFVPFPCPHNLSIGLVTKNTWTVNLHSSEAKEVVQVFIPGTPNPSVGFMLMFRKEQLIFVNMKIEEAMKLLVSCGIIMPTFTVQPNPNTPHEK